MNTYLAGPMRGYPEYNFPTFIKWARVLRREGWDVFSPAERDLAEGFDPNGPVDQAFLRHALHADLEYITLEADAIHLLYGWADSKGACAERATAEALGLQVFLPEHWIGHPEPDVTGRDPGHAMAGALTLRNQAWSDEKGWH